MSAPRWPRLTVVSPGLIGGSIARGARARRLAGEVVVVARHEAAVRTVLDAGAADVGTTDLAAGVAGSSLVVLCAPVGASFAPHGRISRPGRSSPTPGA